MGNTFPVWSWNGKSGDARDIISLPSFEENDVDVESLWAYKYGAGCFIVRPVGYLVRMKAVSEQAMVC